MAAISNPWTARRENLTFFQPTDKPAHQSSHGVTKDIVHALVEAPLAARVVSPLNKMDATRPSDSVTKGREIVAGLMDALNAIEKLGVQPVSKAPASTSAQERPSADDKMLASGASNSWS